VTPQEFHFDQVGVWGPTDRCRIAKLYVACDSNSCHLEEICQQEHSAPAGISVPERLVFEDETIETLPVITPASNNTPNATASAALQRDDVYKHGSAD
jgi:hypothetical protein